MNLGKLLSMMLIGSSLLLGGRLMFLLGQQSIPTKADVNRILNNKVYQAVSYAEQRVVKGKQQFRYAHYGTGFFAIYKQKQVFITNAHVCGTEKHKRYMRAYYGEDKYIQLDIIKIDPGTDLCIAKQTGKNQIDKNVGVRLSEIDSNTYGNYGTLGYNGIEFKVPQVGKKLGERTILSPVMELDHQPTKKGLKINNMTLSLKKRKSLCKKPFILETVENPMKMMFRMMGAPESELKKIPDFLQCFREERQDVYDFHTVGGASGSPVIDLKSGKLVGVVSQLIHPQRTYGGIIPILIVKGFLDKNL